MNRKTTSLIILLSLIATMLLSCKTSKNPEQFNITDLIVSGTIATDIDSNDLASFINDSAVSVFYFPTIDESKEGVIKTARGLVLGDTEKKAKQLYGEGAVLGPDNFLYSNSRFFSPQAGLPQELVDYLNSIWTKGLQYDGATGEYVVIFFDASNRVSGFFFSSK